MDEYSHLMDIDEVVEYLNKKTERNFNQDKVIKFIEERNIPVVFEYKGWVTWEFRSEGKYQPHHTQLKGYFNIENDAEAMLIFKGFLEKIVIESARIYRLNPLDIDSNPIGNLKPKEGDTISFETGGRPPLFRCQDRIEVKSNKVGVLKVDLEDHLKKKDIEATENDTEMEALESKIEKLEFENANLRKQLEELTSPDSLIEQKEQDTNNLKQQSKEYSSDLTKDKLLPYNSQVGVAKMLYAILTENKYDLSATKGKTNELIQIASQLHGTSVSKNFIAKWIELAKQVKNDSVK